MLIINKRQFKRKFLPSVFVVLFVCFFVSLGFWQLERAEYKRDLHEQFVERSLTHSVNLLEIIEYESPKARYLWRSVVAQGVFGKKINILLDNQVMKDRVGYFVYTPMKLSGAEKWILVNRGWMAAGYDRKIVPKINVPETMVSVKGVIKDLPKTGIVLQKTVPEKLSEDIIRVQKVDLEVLEKLLSIDLLPFILRLEPESEYGYKREWMVSRLEEERHLGYAFQWFAFAATLLVIFIIAGFKNKHC